jgi:hypothetical protein
MPNWKKIITSGSDAVLNSLAVTTFLTTSGSLNVTGSSIFKGPISVTGSLSVSSSFTASGLNYPAADNGEESFMQTDGNGNLSLQYVKTIYEEIVNGESTQLVKGTPVYVSGSQGAAAIVYRADPLNPLKMPVVYIAADTLAANEAGRGIALGLIKGVNTTGYPAGSEIYLAAGGGWTLNRPTGSAIVQVLGYVTKEGNGGQGVVLNPGPANLPNLPSGSVWVGNSSSVPVSVLTSSLSVNSASFASTASFATSASFAISSSRAISSSFATSASFASTVPASGVIGLNLSQIATASFTASVSPTQFTVTSASITEFVVRGTGTTIGNAITDTHTVTGSLNISGSTNINGNARITGSLAVTQNITGSRMFLSSSNGTASGSTLTIYGSGSAQPVFTVQGSQGELFSITDSLSGSLFSVNDISGLPILEVFSNGTTLIGNYADPMLITTTYNREPSGPVTIYSLPTSSYDTAFFDYSVRSGSNARAGQIMAIQNGSTVNYTETTTVDFGSTSGVSLGVFVSGSNMVLTGSTPTSGWVIKTIVRAI